MVELLIKYFIKLISSYKRNFVILHKIFFMENNWLSRISINPNVMFGKPVINGTRIPVELILEKIAYGETIEYLLEAYPGITIEDINACQFYALQSVKNDLVFAIA
jgi:uncharacterized protein (DUF433 family)